jgi:O-antigen ligase
MARGGGISTLRRRPMIFGFLVAFLLLYYYRPEDFIGPLGSVPMAKITGGAAFLALLLAMMGGEPIKVPRSIKFLWLLLLQETLCIPGAIWPGGAFHAVYEKFAKGVVSAMLIGMVVVIVKEIRRLLWIQASAVALVTILSILLRHYNVEGRLSGIQNGILSNPNDLAINIAITFPLVIAFMLHSRGFRKFLWAVSLLFMAAGVVMTSSRSGLLALIVIVIVCVWIYGIKGKRRSLVWSTILALVLGMGIALTSSHYRARVESIFLGNVEGSQDKGSLEARKRLLKLSVITALKHPLFGVGPGCFPLVTESESGGRSVWKVAHNAYTELAAEAGIPAILLWLTAIWAAFKDIAVVRKSQQYKDDVEFRFLTEAVWAGLIGFLVGSLFASTEYNLYPYFVVGYACAMVRIVNQPVPSVENSNKESRVSKGIYGRVLRTQPIGSR